MILALVLVPMLTGVLAFLIRHNRGRRTLMVSTAAIHFALTIAVWVERPAPVFDGWLCVDAVGLLFLSTVSSLFLVASTYAVHYLSKEPAGSRRDFEESALFANGPEAVFTGCLLLFLATMALVTVSHNFGLLWVAVEATTLTSAPLIYFHRHHRSLEATWKYLLICSVGIALALLGTFFLAFAASGSKTAAVPLVLEELMRNAPLLRTPWVKVAFIFMLVGYGTKMGLAPLHSWLPDAHSEAPSIVSALLSGALLNCAFLGILRVYQVLNAAGAGDFARHMLLVFGLISVVIATIFIVGQLDFKRMLAYSSIEHMGILAIGIGIGGLGAYGGLLHALNHSLAKGMLFLVAGNILARYHAKSTKQVSGLLASLPGSGMLWIAGLFAITGTPPFGLFQSEFTIIRASFDSGNVVTAIMLLTALSVIFIGMAKIVLTMVFGNSTAPEATSTGNESPFSSLPPALLGLGALLLGVYIPPALNQLLGEAALLLGGR